MPSLLPPPSARSHPPLCYRLRADGRTVDEPLPNEGRLRWAYETAAGAALFHPFFRWPLYSRLTALRLGALRSRALIPAFVERFGLDPAEFEHPPEAYASFAAFFERRLRPEARPLEGPPGRLASPGDGKLLAYPRLDPDARLPVKGSAIPVAALLGEAGDAAAFRGGGALVLRLAPYDYHRFHFAADGAIGPAREVPGALHSVNPIALGGRPDVFLRNRRTVSFQETPRFGRIAYVEVGAFEVGRILQTHPGGPAARGEEKGFFRLGGSTLVLLFEPGRARFDADLLDATREGLETQVRAREGIGWAGAPGG